MWLFVCMWPPISCAMEKIANWNEKPKIPVNVIYTNLFPIWHYTKYVRISSVTLHILCGCLITAWPAKVICSCKHDVCSYRLAFWMIFSVRSLSEAACTVAPCVKPIKLSNHQVLVQRKKKKHIRFCIRFVFSQLHKVKRTLQWIQRSNTHSAPKKRINEH